MSPPSARIVEREFVRELDVAAAVMWWNYWDHEHVEVVHGKGYIGGRLLYEDHKMAVASVTFRVPMLPFLSSQSMSTLVRHDEETMLVFNQGRFGIPSVTKIVIQETQPDRCRLSVRYRFILRGWTKLLAPFLPRMMERWNEQVWLEDLPLKLRRQKMLRHGFRDFKGLPDSIDERRYDGALEFSLPVKRLPESSIDEWLDLGR